jgi:hypothetical protein
MMKTKFLQSAAFRCAAQVFGVVGIVVCFHGDSWAQPHRIPGPIDNGQRFIIPRICPTCTEHI